MNFSSLALQAAEKGNIPDSLIRLGIRRLLGARLAEIQASNTEGAAELGADFVEALKQAPIALVPDLANEQHYELPATFFARVLGAHRKYSSCWWPSGIKTLEQAEEAALRETCERAGLADGQQVLELGCGWGSLTLWMAGQYPGSRIQAVSNSHSQREYIESQLSALGLRNVQVITCDINSFETFDHFDRIVSIEMFEHLRNWPQAFLRVSRWLRPGGRFFMHVFVNRLTPYPFVEKDSSDWMSRYFFSGGMMPSDDLAALCQDDLRLLRRWRWDGRHYQRTANAWLANMDENRDALWPILVQTYGQENAVIWWGRWRVFFMACAELFGYDKGQQWWVSHYLFESRSDGSAAAPTSTREQ